MIMKTRLIVIAALCGALLCSCGNRNKKAQKESVYKETIELTTVEGDHNLEATRIKIADSLVKTRKPVRSSMNATRACCRPPTVPASTTTLPSSGRRVSRGVSMRS